MQHQAVVVVGGGGDVAAPARSPVHARGAAESEIARIHATRGPGVRMGARRPRDGAAMRVMDAPIRSVRQGGLNFVNYIRFVP